MGNQQLTCDRDVAKKPNSSDYLFPRNLLLNPARALSSLQRSRSELPRSIVCLLQRTARFVARGFSSQPGFSLTMVQPRTRSSTHPSLSLITSATTMRSPAFTARAVRLRLRFSHEASFQRMTSTSINPLLQGTHFGMLYAFFRFLLKLTHILTQYQVYLTYIQWQQYFTSIVKGLKIRWSQGRVGSTPSSGTSFSSMFMIAFAIGFLFVLKAYPSTRPYQAR
jgi:hypothetical protein